MEVKINSLYLCVKDMKRAITFYEELFDKKVYIRDEIYSVFVIQGFRLGLFAYEKKKENHVYGNNCLPSIEFDNLEVLKNKIRDKKIMFEMTQIGESWVAEIEDSEGNSLELTAPV